MSWQWWQSVDTRPQVRGRGLTEYIQQPQRRGPMHLWNHVKQPPVQNTLVVWKDGTVSEGIEFGTDVFGSPDVHYILLGGHDYRCDDLDAFTQDSLLAAGYTCGDPPIDLYAENDTYTDVYPIDPLEGSAP
jgi:hypothetical protein